MSLLVLEFGVGKELVIGTDVIVKVIDISRGRVRLAIEAPAEVPVNRREIAESKGLIPCFDERSIAKPRK